MDVNSCRNPMRVSCDFVQNLLLIKTCNFQASYITYNNLLHIMCGYQCDKAVTKNDTREVI